MLIWRLLALAKPYRGFLALAFVAMVLATLADMAVPTLLKLAIDRALVHPHAALLVRFAVGIVAVVLVKGLFAYTQRFAMAYLAQRIIYDLRNALYAHLHDLSFSFYDQAQTGQLMSRVTQDVELLRRFLSVGIINLVSQLLTLVLVVSYLLFLDWRLTLASLVTVPLVVMSVIAFNRNVRPRYVAIQQEQAEMTTALQENITAARVVRAFATEAFEKRKFSRVNQKYFDLNLAAIRARAFYFPMLAFFTGLGTVVLLGYGGERVMAGGMTLGTFAAFSQLLAMLLIPLRMLGWLVNMTSRAAASAQRVFEVLDARPEVADAPDALSVERVRGRVTLTHVGFRYADGPWVLRDINLQAEPGQVVALLGATGSGKSSVIHLIPRFYDPTEGSVRIDGVDVRRYKLESLRRQIGMVMQDTFLFSASIAENIAYGRPGASLDEVKEAAKAAQIHDFIESLPEGYDTRVGERGVGLSGGQKQRVAIARALLLDPPILILDEATSSVDMETERLIQAALDHLMRGRTTFVVAHRLATVKRADLIAVLADGRIVQRGTHAQLMAEPGLYRTLYELQLAREEALEAGHGQTAVGKGGGF